MLTGPQFALVESLYLKKSESLVEKALIKVDDLNFSFQCRELDIMTTPLHVACRNSTKGVVEKMLNKGAKVNACDSTQSTPLHEAAMAGNKGVVQLLLGKGANLYALNQEGNTPYQCALTLESNKDVAWMLKQAMMPATLFERIAGQLDEQPEVASLPEAVIHSVYQVLGKEKQRQDAAAQQKVEMAAIRKEIANDFRVLALASLVSKIRM